MTDLLYYVSGHGFGHATRTAAVLEALFALRPGLRVHVRTQAPAWLFSDPFPQVAVSEAFVDIGLVQSNGIDADLAASLDAHERLLGGWDAAVRREAAFIRSLGPRLVAGDVPALAFDAAAEAGVPSVAVANFGWDWILGLYAEAEPRWRPIVANHARAYGRAGLLLRAPMHGDLSAFPSVQDVGLVVRRSSLSRDAARRAAGVAPDERRKVVLVSFGGLGGHRVDLSGGDDLSGFLFLGFGPPPPGLRAEWRGFPNRTPVPHVDLMRASDAVVSKPGYGISAEALAHRTPLLLLPRSDFRETPVLEAALTRSGTWARIAREDFDAGRWSGALDALLGREPVWGEIDAAGAEAAARAMLARLRPEVEV